MRKLRFEQVKKMGKQGVAWDLSEESPWFVRVPLALWDMAEQDEGGMTDDMLRVMLFFHRRVDWSTGAVHRMCAKTIREQAWFKGAKRPSVSTVQRVLLVLESCGWIVLPSEYHYSENHTILLCNFEAVVKDALAEGVVILRPRNILPYREGKKKLRDLMRDRSRNSCGAHAEHVRNTCGADEEQLRTLQESQDPQDSSGLSKTLNPVMTGGSAAEKKKGMDGKKSIKDSHDDSRPSKSVD